MSTNTCTECKGSGKYLGFRGYREDCRTCNGKGTIAVCEIREEIERHMARAFFASAWADYSERVGPHYPMACEIMDEMGDEIDPAAVKAATELADALEKRHDGAPLAQIYRDAVALAGDSGDRDKSPEMFGHYAAMGAMGHGVSLHDAFGRTAAEFVGTHDCYMEFGMYDLDGKKYPIPENLDD